MAAKSVGGSVDSCDGSPVQEPVEHGGATVASPKAPAQSAIPTQGRGAVLGQRQVAELVDDQKLRTCEEAHAGLPAAFEGGLVALGGEFRGGGEVDAVAGIDGCSSERDGQHSLAHSGRADEQHVGGVVEEAEGGQVADQLLVDAGLGGEVEVGQGPGLGQAGEPFPGGEFAGFGGLDLDLQEPLQGCGQ
ncbi:hypothetical protein ABR737_43215 [Streptomyces sp. Edi2]